MDKMYMVFAKARSSVVACVGTPCNGSSSVNLLYCAYAAEWVRGSTFHWLVRMRSCQYDDSPGA